tara:strand:- start:2440 stop:2796 length:357 start_codon:yes stop_codon:yes gene_type:complete
MKTSGWITFNDDTSVMDIIQSFRDVLDDMDIRVAWDRETDVIEIYSLREEKTSKYTYDYVCEDCDSENVVLLNCSMIWDVDKQDWVYHGCEDPMYLCLDEGHMRAEVKEVDITANTGT